MNAISHYQQLIEHRVHRRVVSLAACKDKAPPGGGVAVVVVVVNPSPSIMLNRARATLETLSIPQIYGLLLIYLVLTH